ncbi:hypothetical protein ABIC07_008314 [Bradyrhizobium sp. RT9a]
MILLAAGYLLSTITAFEDRHAYPSVGHPERRLWLHRARLAWVVRVGADWSWEIRIGRHVTAFGTRPGEDSCREPSKDIRLRSALRMEDARLANRDLLLREKEGVRWRQPNPSSCLARVPRFCNDELAALSRQSVHDLLTTPLELLALLLERFGLSAELRVLARPVVPGSAGGLREERGGEGYSQPNVMIAVRARLGGFMSGFGRRRVGCRAPFRQLLGRNNVIRPALPRFRCGFTVISTSC